MNFVSTHWAPLSEYGLLFHTSEEFSRLYNRTETDEQSLSLGDFALLPI